MKSLHPALPPSVYTEPTCGWWVRWWHRRQRLADALTVIQALIERAPEGQLVPALELFWMQPGQKHWRCACGRPDAQLYREVFGLADRGE